MRSSTGNDVVFLSATRPERTNLPRFYLRILTAAEVEGFQQPASSGVPFDHYVWLFWSIKESVYKFQKRLSPDLSFAPLRIGVTLLEPPADGRDFFTGVVMGEPTLYSRSLIRDGAIVTVVSEDQYFTGIHWGFSAIDSSCCADQSAAVRTLALGELGSVLGRSDLRLQKDQAGCPVVFAGDRPLAVPVSLAHHERYIAYSFLNK